MMKAVTLWPEWAWAICYLGKDVENRGWPVPGSSLGTRIAIHAGIAVSGSYKEGSRGPGVEDALQDVVTMAGFAGIRGGLYRRSKGHRDWIAGARFQYHRPGFVGGAGFVERDLNLDTLTRGAVVATAVVKDSRWLAYGSTTYEDGTESSPWAGDASHNWFLDDVKVLDKPVFCRGHQKVWNLGLKDEVLVRAQHEGGAGVR